MKKKISNKSLLYLYVYVIPIFTNNKFIKIHLKTTAISQKSNQLTYSTILLRQTHPANFIWRISGNIACAATHQLDQSLFTTKGKIIFF